MEKTKMTKELTFAGVKIAPGPAMGAVNIYKPKEENAIEFSSLGL